VFKKFFSIFYLFRYLENFKATICLTTILFNSLW